MKAIYVEGKPDNRSSTADHAVDFLPCTSLPPLAKTLFALLPLPQCKATHCTLSRLKILVACCYRQEWKVYHYGSRRWRPEGGSGGEESGGEGPPQPPCPPGASCQVYTKEDVGGELPILLPRPLLTDV